jgi:hypothetical protein
MLTRDEQLAIDQLNTTHYTVFETNVKQVNGGYVATHVTRYTTDDGIIEGQHVETFVSESRDGVLDILKGIYQVKDASAHKGR